MENKIIRSEKINEFREFLGSKTINLKKCLDLGLNVPAFVGIPSVIAKELFSSAECREEIANEIVGVLKCKKYAIRSSALVEDSEKESMAGQFMTKINISPESIDQAIYEVLAQAGNRLGGDLEKFSMIVQEYIDPDISGITFTRNPNSGREMVVEYNFSEGEKVVGGKVKPMRKSFYWNDLSVKGLAKIPGHIQTIEYFKKLENDFKFPQDIEWCAQGGILYFLQTRPITTISKEQYEQILFLDKILPQKRKYYFEKTEATEITPRPAPATLSLLDRIYSENGPVKNVYQKYGINYRDMHFLKIIGNELFVDKEKEIKGLLPSYSYLSNERFVPRFADLSGLFSTIKNFINLNRISVRNYESLYLELKAKIEDKDKSKDINIEEIIGKLLSDYEIVFETNLLAGFAVKKLEMAIRKENIGLPEIFSSVDSFVDLKNYFISCPNGLQGNSLEILDESDFNANKDITQETSGKTREWWKKSPEYRKRYLKKIIIEAVIYNRLREFGRWLAVKNISRLRCVLLEYAKKSGFKDVRSIYFSTLEDTVSGNVSEEKCFEKKNEYLSYDRFSLPRSITSAIVKRESKTLGVSSGVASGILLGPDNFRNANYGKEEKILYTENLSPELSEYFGKISGIVSNNGGILSHMAILAREKHIPAIVNFSLGDSVIKIGDRIKINGDSGEITKI